MNEICGPIYYLFASQPDKESQGLSFCTLLCIQSAFLFLEFAEADTFFCFSHIMVEIGDKFNKALDSSPTGYSKHKTELWLFIILYCAESALNTMMKLLKRKDAVLYENLVEAVIAYA